MCNGAGQYEPMSRTPANQISIGPGFITVEGKVPADAVPPAAELAQALVNTAPKWSELVKRTNEYLR